MKKKTVCLCDLISQENNIKTKLNLSQRKKMRHNMSNDKKNLMFKYKVRLDLSIYFTFQGDFFQKTLEIINY
jgi:hypothetical protein